MLPVYCAAWIAGTVAAAAAGLPLLLWLVWAALPAGLLVLFWKDPLLRRAHLLLLIFVVAAIRYTATLPRFDETTLAFHNDRGAAVLQGEVVDAPDVRDRSALVRVAVSRAKHENVWRDVNGLALVQVARETDVRYGDRIEIYGEPETPFESPDFSYKDYLARRDIYSVVRVWGSVRVLARDQGNPFHAALYALRARAHATIRSMLPEPAASLLAGILLGDDSRIPNDLANAFRATNTSHIIAISGFNIAIVANILTAFVRRVSRSRPVGLIVILFGLGVYTIFVGASPSVVRAAIMGCLAAVALYYRRENDALNALALAALGMAVVQPAVVWDLSFQLSFLATLGLVLFVQPLARAFESAIAWLFSAAMAQQLAGVLGGPLIVTIAAQITTTPLLIYTFHQLSVVGLLTNLFVVPVQPMVMVIGGLATIVGMIVQPVGQLVAWIAWGFLQWTILVVESMARLPFAVVDTGRLDWFCLPVYFAFLFGIKRYGKEAFSRIAQRVPAVPTAGQSPMPARAPSLFAAPGFALAALVVVFVWVTNTSNTLSDGQVHVEFLDAGGPATFVRTAGGGRVLIDGGGNPSALVAELGERMPFWDRTLDLVVLTDAGDDHIAGLIAALERYRARQIVQVGPPQRSTAAYAKWRKLIAEQGTWTQVTQDGTGVQLEEAVRLEFSQATDAGAALRVQVGTTAILLADGLDEDRQREWLASGGVPESAVMVAPRKLDPEFLDAVNPSLVVLFNGQADRDRPSTELLRVLDGRTVMQTGERGTIEMILGVQGVKVRVEK